MNRKKKLFKVWFIIPLLITVVAVYIYINWDYLRNNYNKLHKLYGNQSSITDLRILGEADNHTVSFSADSLNIVGDLYSISKNYSPCIILLHGSSIYGRKLPLMQVLAAKFYDQGYTVLNIDLRGYGESDDPPALTEKDFDFSNDVTAAIDYLRNNTLIDTGRIFVVGHSWGGAVALNSAFRDKRIKEVVLFGPTRRLQERVIKEGAPDREYFLNRCKRDMQLNFEIEFSVWVKVMNKLDIQNYIDTLGTTTPFYLIDASEEDEKDLEFLRAISESSAGKVDYYTVQNTDHYLYTDFAFNRVFYNSKYVSDFIDHVVDWLNTDFELIPEENNIVNSSEE